MLGLAWPDPSGTQTIPRRDISDGALTTWPYVAPGAQVFFLMVLLCGLVYVFGLLFTQLLDGKNQPPGSCYPFSSDKRDKVDLIWGKPTVPVYGLHTTSHPPHLLKALSWIALL